VKRWEEDGDAKDFDDVGGGHNGTAAAEVTVGAVLSAAGSYHIAVFDVVEDKRADIACGDFERTN
jgi:hypothetical protein